MVEHILFTNLMCTFEIELQLQPIFSSQLGSLGKDEFLTQTDVLLPLDEWQA